MRTEFHIITALAGIVLIPKAPKSAPGVQSSECGPAFDRQGLVAGEDSSRQLDMAFERGIEQDTAVLNDGTPEQFPMGLTHRIICVGRETVAMRQTGGLFDDGDGLGVGLALESCGEEGGARRNGSDLACGVDRQDVGITRLVNDAVDIGDVDGPGEVGGRCQDHRLLGISLDHLEGDLKNDTGDGSRIGGDIVGARDGAGVDLERIQGAVPNPELVEGASEVRIGAELGAAKPVVEGGAQGGGRILRGIVFPHQVAVHIKPGFARGGIGGPDDVRFLVIGQGEGRRTPNPAVASPCVDGGLEVGKDIAHKVLCPVIAFVLASVAVAKIPDPGPIGIVAWRYPGLDRDGRHAGDQVVRQIDILPAHPVEQELAVADDRAID